MGGIKTPDLKDMRCGLVALVGAPNVGKSSLMNALVGEKVGIVSPKANTTRLVVRGVVTTGAAQLVLVDTPGLNQSNKAFDRLLVQQARGAQAEADVLLVVVDASRGFDPAAREIVADLKHKPRTAVLVLNKVDQVKPRSKLLPLMTEANEMGVFKAVLAVAATRKDGTEELVRQVAKLLPAEPWLFPADMATDAPTALRCAEITREKATLLLQQELPYGLTVVPVEMLEEEGEALLIRQKILVAIDRHKGMVVGAGGQMLKKIGTQARQDIQAMLGKGVRLELEVAVDAGWQTRGDLLRNLGLTA